MTKRLAELTSAIFPDVFPGVTIKLGAFVLGKDTLTVAPGGKGVGGLPCRGAHPPARAQTVSARRRKCIEPFNEAGSEQPEKSLGTAPARWGPMGLRVYNQRRSPSLKPSFYPRT